MSEKQYAGVNVMCGTMLPPNTIYCSKDLFIEFQKLKSDKSILQRLKELYENG